MGETLSKSLGLGPVKYNAVEPDVYRSWGFPGADEMGNMFQAYRDFEKEMMRQSQPRRGASAEPGAPDVRPVREREEGRNPGGSQSGSGDGLAPSQITTHRGSEALRNPMDSSQCLPSDLRSGRPEQRSRGGASL